MSSVSSGNRQTGRLDPGPVWKVVTDAPLKGMALAREAATVLAWDDSDHVFLIDAQGDSKGVQRMPAKILSASISDDGSLVAILGAGGRFWLLGRDLDLIEDRTAITDPCALTVDPHGRFVAIASRMNLVQFYTRYGKLSGKMETRQPLAGLSFVPDRRQMVGIGTFSMLMGFELSVSGETGKLGGDLVWTQNLLSSAGRMAITGDGGAVLVACFTHGVQRFEGTGRSEGTYHVGGSATAAVPDFAGRTIAVGTSEGNLSILGGSGNVRWEGKLDGPIIGLEIDPLGQYVLVGMPNGEITKLDLHIGVGPEVPSKYASGRTIQASKNSTKGSSGPVRAPDWSVEVVKTEDQAEVTMLAVLDDPPRIGVIGPTNKLELFTKSGKKLGTAPDIAGVGRILRTSPGWMAAATDRMIVVCDCRKNTAHKVDLSMVEITHLAIRPDDFGLAIVQERDRIGRATLAGRWIWKRELRVPVEEIAIGPEGHFALTLDDGSMVVNDPAGAPTEIGKVGSGEALCLAAAPIGSPANVAWITLARRAQVVRGHNLQGRVVWESPVPFETWQMYPVGPVVVMAAPDGRSIAYNGAGQALGQSRAEGPSDLYLPGPAGAPLRVTRQGVHLICSSMEGEVAWRSVAALPFGPMGVNATGVAVMIGKKVAFFATNEVG